MGWSARAHRLDRVGEQEELCGDHLGSRVGEIGLARKVAGPGISSERKLEPRPGASGWTRAVAQEEVRLG